MFSPAGGSLSKLSDAALPEPSPLFHMLRHDAATALPLPHVLESPSLRREALPAFELKFLLEESQAREIEARLFPWLTLDAHADASRGHNYLLRTLYFDTPRLEVFRRQGRFHFFKFRVRRYGEGERVFLERKSKRRDEVRKRRSTLSRHELSRLAEGASAGGWEGAWYHRQLLRNQLRPVCLIHYERLAFFGQGNDGPFRLTFDRNIGGQLANQYSFDSITPLLPLLAGQVVCELKFRGPIPALFKTVMYELQLVPVGVSKFRHCLRAAGLNDGGSSPHA